MAVALTTFDNPYNPFNEFTSWFLFDIEKGYNSCGYLGRIVRMSDQLSEAENEEEIERGIDEIIRYDFKNIYRKVRSSGLNKKERTPVAGSNINIKHLYS